eukprot:g3998.t1
MSYTFKAFILVVLCTATASSSSASRIDQRGVVVQLLRGGGGRRGLLQANSKQCTGPIPGDGKCFNGDLEGQGRAKLTNAGISKLDDLGVPKELSPWIMGAVNAVVSKAMNNTQLFNPLPSGCAGTFDGKTIASQPKATDTDAALALCSALPFKADDRFSVLSLSIPGKTMAPFCPTVATTGSTVSLCVAFATCSSSQPTLGLVFDKGMLECMTGNEAILAASEGLGELVSLAAKAAFGQASFAVSIGGDLSKTAKVFDGDKVTDVTVAGNFAESLTVSATGLLDAVGVPKDIFTVSGTGTRVLQVMGDSADMGSKVAKAVTGKNVGKALEALTENFSALVTLTGKVGLDIKKLDASLANFPFPALSLGEFTGTMLATTNSASTLGKGGFYAFADGKTGGMAAPLASAGKTLIKYLSTPIGGLLGGSAAHDFEKIGDGIIDAISDAVQTDNALGLALTIEEASFYFKTPVALIPLLPGPPLGDLELSCKIAVDMKEMPPPIHCSIHYDEPKWMKLALEGAIWVAKEVSKDFKVASRVIAAVTEDALKAAGGWTKKAVEDTGKAIAEGAVKVGKEVEKWAKTATEAGKIAAKAIAEEAEKAAEAAKKAAEKVAKEAKKDAEKVADGAKTAVEKLGDAAKAVGKGVETAAKTVADGAKTAVEKTGDAAKAVGEGVETAAKTVADGAKTAVEKTGDAAKAVGEGVETAAKTVADGAKTAVEKTGDAAKAVGKGVETAAKDVGNAFKKVFHGW